MAQQKHREALAAIDPCWLMIGSGIINMGVSINGESPIAGWFMIEKPIKMDDLGVPLFQETSIYVCSIHMYCTV